MKQIQTFTKRLEDIQTFIQNKNSDLNIEIELILSRSNFVSIQFHQFFLLLFKGFLEIVLKVK